jgi:phosphoribosylformimino-5-aminoimidazole carboxamide ribotide isomerase
MRVIPVLDLKAGRAVHAVAGDRAHYGPVRTILHEGSDPAGLARAFRETLCLDELYVADLEAIAGKPPDLVLSKLAAQEGLWVDAGIRDADDLAPLLALCRTIVVLGLETLRGPEALSRIVRAAGPSPLAFSLDLRQGIPLVSESARWGTQDPLRFAAAAIDAGLRRTILLDLARVGTGQGTGTLDLLMALRARHASLEIVVGGGVSGPDDLRRLADAGASAVLVASALHDGRIGREACVAFQQRRE